MLNGTELNPAFFEEIEAAAPNKEKGLILVCNIGGTLEPTGELPVRESKGTMVWACMGRA